MSFKSFHQLSGRTQRVLVGGGTLFISKAVGLASLLFLTGFTSRYLNLADFGLWSVLTNLPLLAATFDLGLGNTLRNRLAILSARADQDDAARLHFYVGVWAFGLLAIIVMAVVLSLKTYIPWHTLFSWSSDADRSSWSNACALGVAVVAFGYPFSLAAFGFYAYQESHWAAIFDAFKNVLTTVAVIVAMDVNASFLTIVKVFFGMLLLGTCLSWSVFIYRRKWLPIVPRWTDVKAVLSNIGSESAQFSILQMSAGVILLTDVMLVGWVCGLPQAGDYALVQRLFTFIIATESLILTPLWSAYTEAHHKKDRRWVKTQLGRSFILIVSLVVGCSVLVYFLGPTLIRWWTHKWIAARPLYVAMIFWTVVHGISHCFSVYLNAVGQLKRQTVLAAAGALANVPLSIALGHLWGPVGICWAGVFCVFPSMISNPIEALGILRSQKEQSQLRQDE